MGRANNSNYEEQGSQLWSWLLGLIIGLLGGATLALLTAPRSGSEIRGTIGRSAKHLPERVSEVVDDSLDLYASFLNYVQLTLEEQTLSFKRAVAAGKLAAAKKREEIETGGSPELPFQHR